MKRRLCLLLVLGFCFVAGPVPGQSDDRDIRIPDLPPGLSPPALPPTIPPGARPETSGWNRPAGPARKGNLVEELPAGPARKGDLVEELIDVLDRTQSVDAFLVTLKLLEKSGARATSAIPAIVRCAERLGLFKNHLALKDRDSELVNEITKSLERIGRETAEPPLVRPAAWRGSTPLTPAPSLCKLQPKDGQREITIVLDCYVAERVNDDLGLIRADDVAYRLRKQIESRFAEEAIKVRVVPVRQVERVRAEKTVEDQAPDAQELAKHFKADYAVCLYIRTGHLIGAMPGAAGGVNVLMQVLDARTPDDDPVHEEEMDLEQTASTREVGPFLRELIDRMTREAVSRLKVQ